MKRFEAQFESFELRTSDSATRSTLVLSFSRIQSQNGFTQIAEVRAMVFEILPSGETRSTAYHQNRSQDSWSFTNDELRIGSCVLNDQLTSGSLKCEGREISWNLLLQKKTNASPPSMQSYSGAISLQLSSETQRRSVTWSDENILLLRRSHPRLQKDWGWASAAEFTVESGARSDLAIQWFSSKSYLCGPIAGPQIHTIWVQFQGKIYFFNSIKNLLSMKIDRGDFFWKAKLENPEYSFDISLEATPKTALTWNGQDTDGSVTYEWLSSQARATVGVYRQGQHMGRMISSNGLTWNRMDHHRNSYWGQIN